MAATRFIQVFTTTPTQALARRIANTLVDKRLAACVQITKVESTFRWEGKTRTKPEWQAAIKTTARRYAAVENEIKRLHPYDTPELLASPIARVEKHYATWLHDSTR